MVTLPLLCSIIRITKINTIIYRPDSRHLKYFESYDNLLVIGTYKDKLWSAVNNKKFLYFYPIYALCNTGFIWIWLLLFKCLKPKRLLVWSDFGLDQFSAVYYAKKRDITSYCFQHGLFPSVNKKDLDGIDCNVNFVVSEQQKRILQHAGYNGKILLLKDLFNASNKVTLDLNQWKLSGKPVIFIGAGYQYNIELEEKVVNLLSTIRSAPGFNFKIIYRPHPQDNSIISKLKSIGIESIFGKESSYENPANLIFLGVKSTYLLEAQTSNRLVILLRDPLIPRYFEDGEINHEIDSLNLSSLNVIINNFVSELDGGLV